MPQEASKLSNPDATADAAPEATPESSKQNAAAESADESEEEETATVEGGEGAEKKKSRKRKIKDALTGKGKAPEITSTESPAGGHLSKDQMTQLLESNPALKQELMAKSKNPKDLEQMIRKLNINEMLTGLAPEGKNTKVTPSGRRSRCRASTRWRPRRRLTTGRSSTSRSRRWTRTRAPCTRASSG
jgi:glycylpeptide N-tetradecanoyltransferase